MTTLKTLHKLGNAIRAQKGILLERGNALHKRGVYQAPPRCDLAPRKDAKAQERVDRWKFRLNQKAVNL